VLDRNTIREVKTDQATESRHTEELLMVHHLDINPMEGTSGQKSICSVAQLQASLLRARASCISRTHTSNNLADKRQMASKGQDGRALAE
jgi:hypothetical protein